MSTTFIIEKYGKRKEFCIGQKVQCTYYHEYDRLYMKDAYRRTWLEKMADPPFKPVKLGVIVGNAGVHPYWLGKDRKEQYLYVKFKEYMLAKPIPISCIEDALEAGEQTLAMLERDRDKIGQKGYGIESLNSLETYARQALNFANKK